MVELQNVSMAQWREYMELIAKYDWATEGFTAPAGTLLTREEATEIRNNLVKLASGAVV